MTRVCRDCVNANRKMASAEGMQPGPARNRKIASARALHYKCADSGRACGCHHFEAQNGGGR